MLVHALTAPPNQRRLERELVLAFDSGATPVVVLTKHDLVDDAGAAVSALQEVAPDVEVLAITVPTGDHWRDQQVRHVLRLLEIMGRTEVPVAPGADLLLALGVRFDDRTSSSWIPGFSFTIPPTKLIHVDIDPEEIGRNYPVALGLMADVRRDVQDFTLADDDLLGADQEFERPLEHIGHLLALVRVHRHLRAPLQVDLRQHFAFAGDDLARDHLGDFFEGNFIPTVEACGSV